MLENKREVIAFLLRCPNCGERRSMREKGIDGRHAEVDSLGLGNQPGTTPFVNASAFIGTNPADEPMTSFAQIAGVFCMHNGMFCMS
jgi:hypothetical protein